MTADEVRRLLHYDRDTGAFMWLVDMSTRAREGWIAGTPDAHGYIVIRIRGRGFKAHRLAWLYVTGHWPEGLIDHINRSRDDNRFENLRVVNAFGNALNAEAPLGVSGLRGVSWFGQYQKWKASFTVNGRPYFVGYFACKHQAYRAVRFARGQVLDNV